MACGAEKMAAVALLISSAVLLASAQVPIPNRPLGFVYKNASASAPIHLDVFIDLECPDCKMAFPVIKQVADAYTTKNIRLKFLVFPLPYHRNAFLAAIGAQAAYHSPMSGKSGDESAIAWAQVAFSNQQAWSGASTKEDNVDQILSLLASYSAPLGYDPASFKKMLTSSEYDWASRVEWKYGCTRGVAGTPWFFINGVNVNADASWTLADWKKVIDPLLKGRTIFSSL